MRAYLLVLLITAATTYLLSGLARRVALRTGAVARVRDRDVHAIPIPYFGGVAMLFGVGAAYLISTNMPFLGRNPLIQHDFRAILIAALVICAVGVLDDLFELNAVAKLAGQVLAAGLVVANGVKMLWIPLPNSIISLDDSASIAITVFFIVLCTNAVNYVDGLDGLAAGVVAIGALAFFTYSYLLVSDLDLPRAQTASLLTVAIAGVCIGFLPHNYFPARMFMGDSGAMLLGLMLATSTISLTGQIDSSRLTDEGSGLMAAYLPLILPLAIMVLPLLDFVLAFLRRTYAGTWFWVADKQHLHHRLLERGHSHRRAVLLMYIWTALISFGVIAVGLGPRWETIAAVVGLMGVATFFTLGAPTGTPAEDARQRRVEREAEAKIQERPQG
ncbi:undecaprenyl/decaprenyl-phosphate alpha-N-acetylglucosaminyl 1-phosphate transferase [Naumannella sp. ID2617S]|uniref:Undecaprenyl-phosphate alpha-N-acetylglucosaminyl 1-phosphate transferase n=1 Tax=Enemella dayhoffiae TaxID=2016507 RepID=A0A255GUF3_9ACTN|nr:MraY family glycosyltransferase [Enemella dayhoffiae]NNG18919.1 undecaprenyl/decaprenyl-phosphate alpha-N-acetylglucosaminyl 1-phosphate transferase [Naumannella sp. ID2617S]OYO19329.1 undecaprenyl-phosphate alpha-N-acetylglucosaminyl 1-phosphate transferase [Enemella dayhoffiae]